MKKMIDKTKVDTAQNVNVINLASKVRRQMIITLLSFVVSLSIIVVSSAAWFANNRDTDTSGMNMQTEVSPNLIIGVDRDAVMSVGDNITDANFSVIFEKNDSKLAAAHSSEGALYRPSSYEGISVESGTGTYDYVAAVNGENGKQYYIQYDVYIAAHSAPLEVSSLNATLTTSIDELAEYQNAASIDFIVNDSVYAGTLNLAGVNPVDGSAQTSVNLASSGTIIPLNTAGCIKVSMILYFDGALLNEEGKAYIRTSSLMSTSDFSMSVKFVAVE